MDAERGGELPSHLIYESDFGIKGVEGGGGGEGASVWIASVFRVFVFLK